MAKKDIREFNNFDDNEDDTLLNDVDEDFEEEDFEEEDTDNDDSEDDTDDDVAYDVIPISDDPGCM